MLNESLLHTSALQRHDAEISTARKPTLCLSRQQRLVSQLYASQDNMARKPNCKTIRQQETNGSQDQLHASQDNKKTPQRGSQAKQMPRKAASLSRQETLANKKAHKPKKTHLHGSRASNACLTRQNGSQTQWLASQNKASKDLGVPNPSYKSPKGRNMPRKAAWIASPTSRIFTGRNPPTLYSPVVLVVLRQCPRLYSTSRGVLGIPVCILPSPISGPRLAPVPPNATPLSRNPKLFPCPPLSRLPGSLPILAPSSYNLFPGFRLLLTSRSCITFRGRYGLRRAARDWRGRSKVRLAACGERRRRDGGWSTIRLAVARHRLYCCLKAISINIHELGRLLQKRSKMQIRSAKNVC